MRLQPLRAASKQVIGSTPAAWAVSHQLDIQRALNPSGVTDIRVLHAAVQPLLKFETHRPAMTTKVELKNTAPLLESVETLTQREAIEFMQTLSALELSAITEPLAAKICEDDAFTVEDAVKILTSVGNVNKTVVSGSFAKLVRECHKKILVSADSADKATFKRLRLADLVRARRALVNLRENVSKLDDFIALQTRQSQFVLRDDEEMLALVEFWRDRKDFSNFPPTFKERLNTVSPSIAARIIEFVYLPEYEDMSTYLLYKMIGRAQLNKKKRLSAADCVAMLRGLDMFTSNHKEVTDHALAEMCWPVLKDDLDIIPIPDLVDVVQAMIRRVQNVDEKSPVIFRLTRSGPNKGTLSPALVPMMQVLSKRLKEFSIKEIAELFSCFSNKSSELRNVLSEEEFVTLQKSMSEALHVPSDGAERRFMVSQLESMTLRQLCKLLVVAFDCKVESPETLQLIAKEISAKAVTTGRMHAIPCEEISMISKVLLKCDDLDVTELIEYITQTAANLDSLKNADTSDLVSFVVAFSQWPKASAQHKLPWFQLMNMEAASGIRDLKAGHILDLMEANSFPDAPKLLDDQCRLLIPKIDSCSPVELIRAWKILSIKVSPVANCPPYSATAMIPKTLMEAVVKNLKFLEIPEIASILSSVVELKHTNQASDEHIRILCGGLAERNLSMVTLSDGIKIMDGLFSLGMNHVDFLKRFSHWFAKTLEHSIATHGDLDAESLHALGRITDRLWGLGFSTDLLSKLCSENLRNSNLTPHSRLMLLSVNASLMNYTPSYKDVLLQLAQDASEKPDFIWGLSREDLLRVFRMHVTVTLEGPTQFKTILKNEKVVKFFEETSYIWYDSQERAREEFQQSTMFREMKDAIDACGWDFKPAGTNSLVYHCEFTDTKELGNHDRQAIIVLRHSDHITVMGDRTERALSGLAHSRIKHLQAIGFKNIIKVHEAEWEKLKTVEERQHYLLQRQQQDVLRMAL